MVAKNDMNGFLVDLEAALHSSGQPGHVGTFVVLHIADSLAALCQGLHLFEFSLRSSFVCILYFQIGRFSFKS
jgi:hypothetical protein